MNKIYFIIALLFVFSILSCNKKEEKIIFIKNIFSKDDSLYVVVRGSNETIIKQYIKKGKTSGSYNKFKIKISIKDSTEISVEIPKWKMENKKVILDCDTIIVVINTTVDEEYLNRKMKEINTIKDSALIPKISIDCR